MQPHPRIVFRHMLDNVMDIVADFHRVAAAQVLDVLIRKPNRAFQNRMRQRDDVWVCSPLHLGKFIAPLNTHEMLAVSKIKRVHLGSNFLCLLNRRDVVKTHLFNWDVVVRHYTRSRHPGQEVMVWMIHGQ